MAKHLIDTDLYIDLIRSGTTLPFIRELYDRDAPGIYFSSIVAQELLAGARSPAGKKHVEILFRPFERVGRVVTPGHNHWKDAGDILAKVLHDRPDLKGKLPALVNDCLLALSARSARHCTPGTEMTSRCSRADARFHWLLSVECHRVTIRPVLATKEVTP